MTGEIVEWKDTSIVEIPKGLDQPKDILVFADALRSKDVDQLVQAFDIGNYEMASSFAWQKAMVGLKNRLGALGMGFIGEMLQRPDIKQGSSPTQLLSDYDAITLASELGLVSASEYMRLHQSMETLAHFLKSEETLEEMSKDEAIRSLKVCVQVALGVKEGTLALEYAGFRASLEEMTYGHDDPVIEKLTKSPYFFKRTTLNALLAMLKVNKASYLEHAINNTNLIIPLLWPYLQKPERFSVGQTYSDAAVEGDKVRFNGLRRLLLKVKGFDYVPENLRSNTFISAANEIIAAHYAGNNFYNEPEKVQTLEQLGTTIPLPAMSRCMKALLVVYLGNQYGVSWEAKTKARTMLSRVREDGWTYYLSACLPSDGDVLFKLMHSLGPQNRWSALVDEFDLVNYAPAEPRLRALIEAGESKNVASIGSAAKTVYNVYHKGK